MFITCSISHEETAKTLLMSGKKVSTEPIVYLVVFGTFILREGIPRSKSKILRL